MAIRVAITGPQSKTHTPFDFIYVNNTSVGKGGINKRIADVQLVQLFLAHFFISVSLLKNLPKPGGIDLTALSLNGKVSEATIVAIKAFQEGTRRGGVATIVDGLVSVPRGGLNVGGTNDRYTIVSLNNGFFFDAVNVKFNANLEDHPVVRSALPHLAAELKAQKAAA